jgi:RNA polymerase sigma factor (TIGR02999 family)
LSDAIKSVDQKNSLLRERTRNARFDNVEALYEAVYSDLKRLARRHLYGGPAYTNLPVTVLVHECYTRLAHLKMPIDRAAFFMYAAQAMRSIVIDYVRSRATAKRDGIAVALTLADNAATSTYDESEIIAIDSALIELEAADKRAHDLVELRFFGGFTLEECAEQLGISMATATRDWQKARAFLGMVLRAEKNSAAIKTKA